MKRAISLVLVFCFLLSACGQQPNASEGTASHENILPTADTAILPQGDTSSPEATPTEGTSNPDVTKPAKETPQAPDEYQTVVPDFYDLSDPHLLQYVEDNIYANLVDEFSSEDYIIENVSAIYYSKEYLEEVAYNSKANIFFGYTLAELDEQFHGERYVFTLNDNGETTVQLFENYDDTYDQVVKNVAIGTGVILLCVTVSVVGGAAGASTVSMIFAASAKTGTAFALSSAGFSGVFAGAVTGIQTKNFDQAIKAAALTGSESFKWGAISGALIGGLSEAHTLRYPELAEEPLIIGQSEDEKAPMWRRSELRISKEFGGDTQKAFLNQKEVTPNTLHATRPDIIRTIDDHLEAVEIKNYNLENPHNVRALCNELRRQVSNRITNCPPDTTQRIVLDVTERNFSTEVISNAVQSIETALFDIYPNIPIQIFGL